MNEWSIERYNPTTDRELWNRLNGAARNATFLTDRNYMDYHSDRFRDYSLIARKGKVTALLPANITGDNILHSHQGLTYGGWILPRRHFDSVDMMSLWEAMLDFCKLHGIRGIDYKPLPHIYAVQPSQEDIYALFRFGGRLTECNISAAVKLTSTPGFNEMRRRQLKKSAGAQIEIAKADSEEEYREFHTVLTDCLSSRHDATPVHNVDEMLLLAGRFPQSTELWVAKSGGEIHAGIWLYLSEKVAHCQYIGTTAKGRETNMLTALIDRLIKHATEGQFGPAVEYFDFGTSNEDNGLILNENLYRQKASMGASGVACPRYMIEL